MTDLSPRFENGPVLFCSAFTPDAAGHGGQRRTAQLVEMLTASGLEPQSLDVRTSTGRGPIARSGRFLRSWKRGHELYGRFWGRVDRSLGVRTPELPQGLPGVVVLENTSRLEYILYARRCGWAVVAVPQNLESLYRARERCLAVRETFLALADEVEALRHANAIYCISREEQYVLRAAGLSARFLPYFPPVAALEPLLAIRRRREANATREHVLLLAYAGNSANRHGIVSLLKGLTPDLLAGCPSLLLAGFGTKELSDQLDPRVIRVIGEVSASQLEELLIASHAVIAHQEYGPGSLTKITEMLTAGVPVVANEIAARSHQEYDGLHPYVDTGDLIRLLSSPLPVPALPSAPHAAASRFCSEIRTLAGRLSPDASKAEQNDLGSAVLGS